jgi:hypothetical protein
MKQLRLKNEFTGMVVSKIIPTLGVTVEFNALQVQQQHYRNFYNVGFQFLFEEVVEIKNDKDIYIKETKNKKPSK